MVACAAYGCNNHKDKKKPGVTYHKFPKKEERRAAWVKAVRRENWCPSNASVLCSEHFLPEDMDRTSLRYVRLRENAIPSIFPAFPSYLKSVTKERRQVARRKVSEIQHSQPPSDVPEAMEIDPPTDNSSPVPTANSATPGTSHECCGEVTMLRSELKRVKALYLSAKRKVKALQQAKRRHIKRKAELSNVLKALKNKHMVNEDGLSVLENISGPSKVIFNRLLMSGNGKASTRKYEAKLRAFALTLNFFSPRAYKFVRNAFDTCLPHPRTITKWYSSMDGKPGLTIESLNTLKLKVKQSEVPIHCTLLVDDMAIRKHVEWDGFTYHGYVHYGSEFNDDTIPVAKEATVFMVVGMNANWKIPVAYFLTDGMSGEQRANLMLQVLRQVHDTGAIVSAVTFDGAASNIAMARTLGCQLTHPDYVTSFPHPETKHPVHVFLDPSHMIKLIRNTLGEKKTLIDGSNSHVKWELIEKLKELHDSEGLHLANKLRNAHLQWQKQKMKVKLATQVLSNSVADAIEFCSELGVPGFEESAPSCQFLRVFNKLFDIFNSRNILQKGWKKPLCAYNFHQVVDFLSYADKYICDLKDANGVPVLLSNRKVGFMGFRVCIKSLRGLYTSLVESNQSSLRYLSTYKISQDHLEIFFSCIRSQGGYNNNPTARQFSSAYKKLLVQCQVSGIISGNCLPLEEIKILNVGSGSGCNSVGIMNGTSCHGSAVIEDSVSHDHCYFLPHPHDLSEVADNIVTYIAGFIVRSLEKRLKCDTCCEALRGDGDEVCGLIRKKDRGGLVIPSPDVIKICRYTEKVVRASLHSVNVNVLQMVSSVLKAVGDLKVLEVIREHAFDQEPENNHWVHLIRAIAYAYAKIRLHYAAKCKTEKLQSGKIRQKLNKIVLFRGQ